ncbi:putative sphingosine-1-phosphate phosphatase [Trypanosoma grayi]|uniref:putative sphingosine-1-phosphate phosphatase n=1 Tax=Trypanosoma grayi TaxID=71804 RepID=UPI0004F43F67|nr:putative sphingosine-1-phosphate phosphatase [Trypanosoma grayi]KEG14329.1 putative sphingosine-1-phosphate phosphatase [Trypanosoma grayi]
MLHQTMETLQPDVQQENHLKKPKHEEAVVNFISDVPASPRALPQIHKVPFKSWYMSNYCNDVHLLFILRVQRCLPSMQRVLTFYFKTWSITGETEFYTTFIPLLFWMGLPFEGLNMCLIMCISQYITGAMKDKAGCPRPPCPPVDLRGRVSTSKEYGYPSTHASHSVVFPYAAYNLLALFLPDHPILCSLVCIAFSINVSLSRLFLGMHWPADLVAGWGLAGIIVTFHRAFLEDWLTAIFALEHAMLWHYAVAFLIMHVLAVLHAAPADPCPCYLDSLRFLGATLGAFFGTWIFRSHYGVAEVRTLPTDVWSVVFSFRFFAEYMCCLLVLVIGKELTSFASPRFLRWFFLMASRRVSGDRSGVLQRVCVLLSHTVRRAYCIPYHEDTTEDAFRQTPQHQDQCQASIPSDSISASGGVGNTTKILEFGVQHTPEVNGFLRENSQMWSPRTHKHWWLWEAHRCTISYFAVGLLVACICPMILREFFGVK